MSDWKRVSKRRPCPICQKPDWCGYAGPDDDPTAALCMRIESDKPAKNGGWLHILKTDGPTWPAWRRTFHIAAWQLQPEASTREIEKMAKAAAKDTPDETLQRLASDLGVSFESLRRLDVGCLEGRRCWSFPMRTADGDVTGIRLRFPDGRKLSVKGGGEGLFIPIHLERGGRLLICEGPTDTAALLDLGSAAVGRPSCTGGVRHLIDLVKRLEPAEVVVVADGDGPGQRGAASLAGRLLAYVRSAKVITPPNGSKDARAWKRSGGTAAELEELIGAAPSRRLQVAMKGR